MIARSCLVLALVAGCHKKTEPATAGSGAGSSVAALGSGSAAVAPATPPKDVGKALDDALAAKHVPPDAVLKRVASATSAWAVVAGKMNDAKEMLSVDVLASRADGVAEVHIDPPAGKTTINQVDSLDGKDLDGDGKDEGVLVLQWTRETRIPGPQKDWFVMTDEKGKQLYVLGGPTSALRVAFSHLVSYETNSEGLPEDNPTAYPDAEEVTYDWSLVPGKPPAVKLTRTKSEIATKDRLKGVLDPATDPLFAAGSGKDLPIALP